MRINISRIQARLNCPAYEHYRYRLERAPEFAGAALYTGIAVHKFFEVFLLHNGTREIAMAAMENEFSNALGLCDPGGKMYDKLDFDLRVMRKVMPHWNKPPDWNVLAVEKQMEVETQSGHTLFGRLDALVDWNDRLWHLQHKTTSVYTAMDVYVRGIQRSWHENVYGAMIKKAFPERKYGGTILNIVRKLTLKGADLDPLGAFKVEYLPISERSIAVAMRDLDQIIATMDSEDQQARRAREGGSGLKFEPVQYRGSCTAYSSVCPYIDVCEGTDTIDSDRFKTLDPLSAYASPNATEP